MSFLQSYPWHFTKCSPNASPNTYHTMTQRVSLSYSLSTLLKGETRELFDKITQWKKHQRTAIPVPCFRVLAISLVDYKDWNSGHHTPPGGVEVDFLWRLGSLAQKCCYSLWSSMMRQKSNEQPFKIAAGLLNEDSRAKATLWDTRQILKPASMVKSLLNPKWWEKLCLKISEERLRNQTMCAFVVATNISPNIPHLYVIISSSMLFQENLPGWQHLGVYVSLLHTANSHFLLKQS